MLATHIVGAGDESWAMAGAAVTAMAVARAAADIARVSRFMTAT
jgi:hypothetical protein